MAVQVAAISIHPPGKKQRYCGCHIFDVELKEPCSDCSAVQFRNDHSYSISILFQSYSSDWKIALWDYVLMPTPHSSGKESQDWVNLPREGFQNTLENAVRLRVLLKQPSPHWKKFGVLNFCLICGTHSNYTIDMKEFQIPAGPKLSNDDDLRTHEISSKLEECRRDLSMKVGETLPTWYPLFNSVISKFSELDACTRELCWEIVLNELHNHSKFCAGCDIVQQDQNNKRVLRNSTKMLCFVAVTLSEKFENEAVQIYSKEKKSKQTVSSISVWEKERQRLTSMLVDLYRLELMYLWEPPSAPMMEDLSALLASLCYKFLENPMIVRDKVLLDSIADLLGLVVKKYGLSLSVSLKLIQLLQHFDHLVNPISTIVSTIVTKFSFKQIVLDMFREVGSKNPCDLAMDSSGTKSFASFLVAVSVQVPATVLPVVPVLLPHLSGESTTFRNGVIGVLGELLKLPSDCSGDASLLPDTRDQLLRKVLDHLHDTNAFVRVKVLHVLLQLCSVQAIPLPALQGLLEKVAGRLKDKSSLARKGALQLLCAMLSNNPFAAKLEKNELIVKLEKEKKNLVERGSDEPGSNTAVVQYLQAAIDFIISMAECVPVAVEMLGSKVVSDVLESLEFLCTAQLFQVNGANESIAKTLPLVWSQDEQLRNAVVSVYIRLYLTPDAQSTFKERAEQIVDNLLHIVSASTSGQLASLEKLVGLLVAGGHVPLPALKQLWEIYHLRCPERSKKESVLACQLLSMAIPVNATTSSISSDLDNLVSGGLAQSNDLLLAKYTCSALNKLVQCKHAVRLALYHTIFDHFLHILTSNFRNTETSQWIPLCEQVLNVVYHISEQPTSFSETLLKDLSQVTFTQGAYKDGFDSLLLSRLLFCAGHTAQCQVIHCELTIVNERKKVKTLSKKCPEAATAKGETEEELGMVGTEDQDAELVHKVMETEVGGSGGMLAVFEPLIVCVVSSPIKFSCDKLQTVGALSLSKYMLISPVLCEKYLQIFFTILEKSSLPTVRANLIIAASDLVCRFPNTIEPWTPFLYNRLKDECQLVRKNTAMVLTHLILNDMIKIRGQVSAMALCLEDTESSIVELAKVFFYELSQKGNTLYNVLPDIISQLSDPNGAVCSQASFRNVIKYLLHFIKKDKHHESLIEKLCHRLRAIRNKQQSHDLAYCISLFSPTEKGLAKLQENFACYQEKLADATFYKHLLTFVTKAKKAGKNEVKVLAEEIEKRMYDFTQTGFHSDGDASLTEQMDLVSNCGPNSVPTVQTRISSSVVH